jgi:hypothetical protein
MVTEHEKQLLTLLAACVKDDTVLGNIVLQRISSGNNYRLINNIEEYSCFTNKGISVCNRMKQFKLPESAHYNAVCKLESDLNNLAAEFQSLLSESEASAKVTFGDGYKDVHVIRSSDLSRIMEEKLQALQSEQYYTDWQNRDDFVYKSNSAVQLKKEMDSFKLLAVSLQELHGLYQQLKSYSERLQKNTDIITKQKLQMERKENSKKEIKNAIIAIVGLAVFIVICVYWGPIVKVLETALTWVLACSIIGLIGYLYEKIFG